MCVFGNTQGKLLEGVICLWYYFFLTRSQLFCIHVKWTTRNMNFFKELSPQVGKLKNTLPSWKCVNEQVLLCTLVIFIYLFLDTSPYLQWKSSCFKNRCLGPAGPETYCYCSHLRHSMVITATVECRRWLQKVNFCPTASLLPPETNLPASCPNLSITSVYPTLLVLGLIFDRKMVISCSTFAIFNPA